jgi:hypothetical protein
MESRILRICCGPFCMWGIKFNEKIVLNTEIEIEHADEIYAEMVSLDFLLSDKINFRADLLLTPVGITNEL